MRSPLSSRTNSRLERVTPDEFFDLVASSVVMVFPSVLQLRFDSARRPAGDRGLDPCLRWSLSNPRALPPRVKPRKSRPIVANENSLRETDVADVDANDQHVQDRPPFRATRAPFGTQMNAVHHDVVWT